MKIFYKWSWKRILSVLNAVCAQCCLCCCHHWLRDVCCCNQWLCAAVITGSVLCAFSAAVISGSLLLSSVAPCCCHQWLRVLLSSLVPCCYIGSVLCTFCASVITLSIIWFGYDDHLFYFCVCLWQNAEQMSYVQMSGINKTVLLVIILMYCPYITTFSSFMLFIFSWAWPSHVASCWFTLEFSYCSYFLIFIFPQSAVSVSGRRAETSKNARQPDDHVFDSSLGEAFVWTSGGVLECRILERENTWWSAGGWDLGKRKYPVECWRVGSCGRKEEVTMAF